MKVTTAVLVSVLLFTMLHPESTNSSIAAGARWTDVEAWVWDRIRMGKEAKLSGPCPNDTNGETGSSIASRSGFTLALLAGAAAVGIVDP